MDGVQSSSSVPRIQVFRPTWEEFKDFNSYILQIEKAGAHKAGLAKIIPPPEWKPRADGYDMNIIGDIDIPAPISQVVQGKQGVYQQFNIQKNSMKVRELKRMAENPRYATPTHFDYEDLDRKYWRNISYFPPIYGADVSGSLTDPDVEEWNINKLGSILDYVNEDYGISIDGVNTAYLYFGMWKSSFAWHTEDMDLYSINYLHFGEPKSWYCVPPDHGARLERLANNFFPSNCKECPAYLRHKMTVISPAVLKNHCIPVNKIVQEAGEFMITFPYGYHAGFNHGFNCAESTNFASPRWVEYGKRATQCSCRPDMVKISMDTFVKRFQPDRYDLWVQGKDIGPHPEVPGRNSAAPHPSREEILCNKNNPDLPESFVEPTKKKAKRHLIHQKLEQPEEQQHEQVAIKEEIISPIECEEPVTEEDSDLVETDEQAFEVMKEIYYKAGEMESDGLDDWDKEKSDESKRKGKKPVKRPKLKSIGSSISGSSSSDSQQLTLKHRRIKPEFVQRNPCPQVGPVESTAPSSTGTPAKLAPVRPVNMFSGFRIPKKAPIPAADIDAWTEAEHNASRALTSLAANVHFTPTIKRELPDQCESKKEFSKTRIQTPSPNSHIKSCPAVAQRCPSPTSPFQHGSTSSSGIVSASHKALEASASSADIQMNKPVFQQPIIHMKNSKSPGSDERRSRKQKCPRSNRSGLDARDLSANLTHLWLKQKDWTLTIEAEFNLLSSRQEPYCSVCSLLRPPAVQRDQQHQPTSSTVLLPEELFGSNRSGSTSILLRCSSCRVCVHAKCYGVSESVSAITWLCRRCERSEDSAKCCLCVQRGGALKSTSDGRWAHILCTLCFPSVFFNQPALREPIVVDQLSRDSVLLSCTFCSDQSDSSKVFYHGICMPCCGSSAGKRCGRAFHPMCGLVNGVRFSLSQEGQISGSCCSPSSRVSVKKKIPHPVPIGQQVYAKHPDGRFCLADVIDNSTTVTFYSVDFSDGSKSQDTFPEDIRNYNCREDGPPPLGAAVDVMWTDGKCYDGYYRGQNHIILYKLRFCDGDDTVVEAERDKFYHPDEDLPKRLRDQLGKQLIVPAHMNRLHHPNFQS